MRMTSPTMTNHVIEFETTRTAKVPVNSAGIALGLLLGGLHLLWVLLVATGGAQPLIDFIFWLHFIRPVYVIEAFDPFRAAGLVLLTATVGYSAEPLHSYGTKSTARRLTATMPAQGPEFADQGHRFSDALALFANTVRSERVDLATIDQFMGRRSIGALLLILALSMALPIPAPGISVLFGLPLILISAQLLFGRRRAWLPTRLARLSISRSEFVAFVERALPSLRRLERFVRPRIGWMAGDWAMVPVGAVCFILAIIITLPVPLGHMLPGTAISVLALGLLETDGLAIALGLATAVMALVIVAVASNGIATWLHAYFG